MKFLFRSALSLSGKPYGYDIVSNFTCDGDTLLIIQDKHFTDIVKRHMEGIMPLYYDAKKAAPMIVDSQAFYDNMVKAFTSGNIGIYSNNISKIWNSGKVGEEELATIKLLCMENNYVISNIVTSYGNICVKAGEPVNAGCAM